MVYPASGHSNNGLPWSTPPQRTRKGGVISLTTILVVIGTAIPSFFMGTLVSLYAGIQSHGGIVGDENCAVKMQQMELKSQQLQEQVRKEMMANLPSCRQEQGGDSANKAGAAVVGGSSSSSSESLFNKDGFGKHIVSMSTVDKTDFIKVVDPGVPIDLPQKGANDVLMLYTSDKSLPESMQKEPGKGNPKLSMADAVQNCNQVNVILNDHSGNRQQCIAVVPQYESYHIQKWMRVHDKDANASAISKIPLELVSRGQLETGRDAFKPPKVEYTRQHWEMLQTFLKNFDDVQADLKPILEKIARNGKTVVVMVCNFGQSELLANFVCAAQARNLDVSHVIVFAADQETKELAEGLGLASYYDHRNFADIPEGAARRYGDPKFSAMMMAKVLCVLHVSWLGYDMLFQDVDIIWYKDPLEYFGNSTQYDISFQDDGGHTLRYAPYSANSGFYFVRYNDRTRHFLTALLLAGGDMVLSTKSHQQALIALLQEHVSLHGLKAKVLSRDMEEFPGGYQFNQKSGKYLRAFFDGTLHPYIFHMSWTMNKKNKLLYFRQMGGWYVQDTCIEKKRDEIVPKDDPTADLKPLCCSAEPLISCHYRDKPSKFPCKDSPPIDKGHPSWWK